MPDKTSLNWIHSIALFLVTALFVFFPYSRGVASICVGIMGLIVVVERISNKIRFQIPRWYILTLLVYVGSFVVADLFNLEHSFRLTLLKLPVAVGPLFIFSRRFTTNQWMYTIGASALVVLFISTASVLNYLSNKEEIDALLLQSKHIPVATGMHHIQFGVINALVTGGVAFILLFHSPFKRPMINWLAWLVVLLMLVNLHILSSRTGLLGFYVAVGAVVITSLFKEKHRKKAGVVFVAALVAVVVNLGFNDSLKNKVINSSNDLNAARKGGEHINFNSMSMRLEAYQNAWYIIQHNPLGTGAYSVEESMDQAYDVRQTALIEENRIGPHNQFLEDGIRWGVAGMLLVLGLFLPWVLSVFKYQFPPVEVFGLVLIGFSFLLESQLERQYGIITFAFLLPVLIQYSRNFIEEFPGE